MSYFSAENDDCKRDLEKEQGKGQQAAYVHRRRQYRRVVNPKKCEQPKGVVIDEKKKGPINHVSSSNEASIFGTKDSGEAYVSPVVTPYIRCGHGIDKWIKKIYTKATGPVVPTRESIPIINSFAGLETINEMEPSPMGEEKGEGLLQVPPYDNGAESKVEYSTNPVDNTQGKEDGVVLSVQESVLGSMMNADKLEVQNLDGFQAISKDFQEDMGTICKEFTVHSAASGPTHPFSMSKANDDYNKLGSFTVEDIRRG
ncbi:hypothetical protein LIER_25306 [Lithospermum erythrorhizon]|uniref:Uncharacterized protein n=1 Tax=Lithospermum erythrorhizon TaxID=34254 RepID=A0AAV3R4E6_LITER